MPDLRYESPVTATYPAAEHAALALQDQSSMQKTLIRADADSPTASSLDARFGTSRTTDGALVAGTRPDEWLVIGTVAAVETITSALSTEGHVSLVDWTHGRAAFRLTGDDATRALEKLCSIDWADAMTPDGAVFSASVAGTTCDIVRHDLDGRRSYVILCDRSFGQYLFDAVLDSGEEFGIGVTA